MTVNGTSIGWTWMETKEAFGESLKNYDIADGTIYNIDECSVTIPASATKKQTIESVDAFVTVTRGLSGDHTYIEGDDGSLIVKISPD